MNTHKLTHNTAHSQLHLCRVCLLFTSSFTQPAIRRSTTVVYTKSTKKKVIMIRKNVIKCNVCKCNKT